MVWQSGLETFLILLIMIGVPLWNNIVLGLQEFVTQWHDGFPENAREYHFLKILGIDNTRGKYCGETIEIYSYFLD